MTCGTGPQPTRRPSVLRTPGGSFAQNPGVLAGLFASHRSFQASIPRTRKIPGIPAFLPCIPGSFKPASGKLRTDPAGQIDGASPYLPGIRAPPRTQGKPYKHEAAERDGPHAVFYELPPALRSVNFFHRTISHPRSLSPFFQRPAQVFA